MSSSLSCLGRQTPLHFGRAACCLCFSIPRTYALRESGDVAAQRQTYRCAMFQGRWLAASQLWPWSCEKEFRWPGPVRMSPAKKWGIWNGVLTSRVEQGWVQTSRSPGKDSYSACLNHLERWIHLYLLCTQLLSEMLTKSKLELCLWFFKQPQC